MHANIGSCLDLPPPADNYGAWLNHIAVHNTSWNKSIAKAVKVAIAQGKEANELHAWRAYVEVVTGNQPSQQAEFDGNANIHVCNVCAASFPSKQQCALHAFREHGVKHPAAKYSDGSRCHAVLA
jgi:hypothetical protein